MTDIEAKSDSFSRIQAEGGEGAPAEDPAAEAEMAADDYYADEKKEECYEETEEERQDRLMADAFCAGWGGST